MNLRSQNLKITNFTNIITHKVINTLYNNNNNNNNNKGQVPIAILKNVRVLRLYNSAKFRCFNSINNKAIQLISVGHFSQPKFSMTPWWLNCCWGPKKLVGLLQQEIVSVFVGRFRCGLQLFFGEEKPFPEDRTYFKTVARWLHDCRTNAQKIYKIRENGWKVYENDFGYVETNWKMKEKLYHTISIGYRFLFCIKNVQNWL